MRSEGTGGAAVTRVNDPEFQMFATKSGRDIHSDLERAHRPFSSPIKLRPLTPEEEQALYSEDRPARRTPRSPAPRPAPRKPAPPARLPASRPDVSTVQAVGPSAATPPAQAGRGQTTRKGRSRFDHDQVVQLYQDGYSPNQISRKIGCSRQTIINILTARGIVRRRYSVPKPEPAQQVPTPPTPPEPGPDLHAASAAIVDHMHARVSLPTTVRRLAQAGFSVSEIAIYAGVIVEEVADVLLSIVRDQVAV